MRRRPGSGRALGAMLWLAAARGFAAPPSVPGYSSLPAPQFPGAEARARSIGTGVPRADRPWVFSGELGWNGLAGIGLIVTFHADPRFSLETGLGVSAEGAKLGLRGRYNFSRDPGTPFLGLGFLYATGNDLVPGQNGQNGAPYRLRIDRSPYLQAVIGYDYVWPGGFDIVIAGGYARLLANNLEVVSGTPDEAALSAQRVATGSGLVLSVALGQSF